MASIPGKRKPTRSIMSQGYGVRFPHERYSFDLGFLKYDWFYWGQFFSAVGIPFLSITAAVDLY